MNFIAQMEPWFGDEEKNAINEYMEAGGWITEFKKTAAFEKMIAEYTNAKECIVVNNGTISLTLAALAIGLQSGDEILVPNYTMIATANSAKMIGATPVFVDVERETLCMDIKKAEKAITSKTKALTLVTANGRYPKSGIESFIELANKYNLVLLEDSAQSLGSFYPNGKHQGTVGKIGSFSFSAPKVISTGQGGALVTNDEAMAFKIRKLKDFGRSGGGNDIHDSIGYNFKFTELQACIGIEQMKKLPWRVDRKKEIMRLYKELLKDVKQITFFEQDLERTSPWFVDVFADDRDDLMRFLKDSGVGTRVMYPPINHQLAYQVPGEHEVSNLVGKKGLWLPSSSQLSNEQIQFVCKKIKAFFK
ncbi:MAG: DegT/DnrJ/EryC1/StrS family aminotransferase [Candidatus Omnitrophica bacterium]|nr:DegT/DnrJ/EryC1/StrS family aminotransferase [Candidatus Omnitrophota bacterium]